MKTLVIALLVIASVSAIPASISAKEVRAAGPSKAKQEELLSALIAIDFGYVYLEDGAADGSVTEEWRMSESGPEAEAFAKVKAVVGLKAAVIPLLIEHLDDPRPTRTSFNGRPVLVGHLALDILSHIVGPNRKVFDVDCADDGLGACFNPGYYFRPDARSTEMTKVKAKWQTLYRKKAIEFKLPQLWE